MKQHIAQEAVKATPPLTVVSMSQSWTLNDTVLMATLIYVIMQAGYLAWKWLREYRKQR